MRVGCVKGAQDCVSNFLAANIPSCSLSLVERCRDFKCKAVGYTLFVSETKVMQIENVYCNADAAVPFHLSKKKFIEPQLLKPFYVCVLLWRDKAWNDRGREYYGSALMREAIKITGLADLAPAAPYCPLVGVMPVVLRTPLAILLSFLRCCDPVPAAVVLRKIAAIINADAHPLPYPYRNIKQKAVVHQDAYTLEV